MCSMIDILWSPFVTGALVYGNKQPVDPVP